MKKNLLILGLVCVIFVLAGTMWFKESLKENSQTATSSAISITNPPSAQMSTGTKDKAPVASKSEVDQKLQKLGFGGVAGAHKIVVSN